MRFFCFSVVLLLTGMVWAAPAPKPQPFRTGWDRPTDPDEDCKFKYDRDTLIIELPGTHHDHNPGQGWFNAPRLLRERESESDFDIQVRVRVDGRPSIKSTVDGQLPSVSAGFLLILSDNSPSNCTCYRLDYRLTRQESETDGYIDMRHWNYRERRGKMSEGGWKGLKKGWKDGAHLQVDRHKGYLGFSASSDGKSWKGLVGTPSRKKLKIGLAAYSSSTEPAKVRFDQLKITRCKKKEPLKKPLEEPLFGPGIYKASLP